MVEGAFKFDKFVHDLIAAQEKFIIVISQCDTLGAGIIININLHPIEFFSSSFAFGTIFFFKEKLDTSERGCIVKHFQLCCCFFMLFLRCLYRAFFVGRELRNDLGTFHQVYG
jgi:hypothetical protein